MSYDQYAQTFSKSRQDHPWPELGYIIADMRHRGSQSILDIGCGNGRFIENYELGIMNYEFRYLGIDNSLGMTEEAKRLHPGYDFEVCDMLDIHVHFRHREERSDVAIQAPENSETLDCFLRRNDEGYDIILLLASFHHLETLEARRQVLRDMRSFLKEGARIYMTNWNLREQLRYADSHRGDGDYDIKIGKFSRYYHGFTIVELESLFLEAGYRIVENRVFEGGRNIVSILEW